MRKLISAIGVATLLFMFLKPITPESVTLRATAMPDGVCGTNFHCENGQIYAVWDEIPNGEYEITLDTRNNDDPKDDVVTGFFMLH